MANLTNELVWVPDAKTGYVLAEVTDMTGGNVTACKTSDLSTVVVPLDKALPAHRKQDLGKVSYPDNTQLIYLHAASLLNNLNLRYEKDLIYTYTGHILIAVNPYKQLPIYEGKYLQQYRNKSIGLEPPHVYAIADYAYRSMKSGKISQSIIVSGESGAGKTETSKYIMKYLTSLAHADGKLSQMEQIVLETSPLLESFGNAKTIRNRNSSRFGKFIEIHFDHQATLSGASISHYLLEKSRVILQSPNERNYHVFYELCAGASPELKKELEVTSAEKFKILSTTTVVQGVDDKAMFNRLLEAMKKVGMSEDEKNNTLRVVAAVLHIGNIEFVDDDGHQGGAKIANFEVTKTIARLLGVQPEQLIESLCTRLMSAVGKSQTAIRKPLKRDEAALSVSALAKSVYKCLFDWIVKRINVALPFKDSANYIGVLDIAGFEYFDNNSYEQFCINYCNEKLQGFFNEKVLKQEQEIYSKEGITVPPIRYLSNEDCIEMIEENKNGIFAVLDDESKMVQANDKHFSTMLHDKHGKHPKFANPKKAPLKSNQKLNNEEAFVIRHYAGAVCYQTNGFIEKNNDALSNDLEEMLKSSSNPFVVDFSTLNPEDAAVKGKLNYVSVGAKFKKQLKELLTKLENTKSHFIRCIKPNMSQEASIFDGVDILQQLFCGGMMEVLELMQKGYPSRTDFRTLYDMYKDFLPPLLQNLDVRTFCEALIFALGSGSDDFKFGLTKVFFRAGKYALLDEITRSEEGMAQKLIEKVRGWLVRKRWKKFIFAALSVRKLMRKIHTRVLARVLIQTMARSFIARDKYVEIFQKSKDKRIAKELEEARRKAQEEAERLAREAAERERKRLEELARIEAERRRKEEEEEKRRREEAEKERLRRLEEQRRLEEEQRRQREEEERLEKERILKQKLLAEKAAQEEEKKRLEEEKIKREREEQEQRDQQLALRLARDLNQEPARQSESPGTPTTSARPSMDLTNSPLTAGPPILGPGGVDLSKWSYAQLRDAINSSTDLEMLTACRNEFQKRLKAYYNWKQKYEATGKMTEGTPGEKSNAAVLQAAAAVASSTTSTTSTAKPAAAAAPAATAAPNKSSSSQASASTSTSSSSSSPSSTTASAAAAAASTAKAATAQQSSKSPAPVDRFFRIPFARPGVAKGKAKKKGLWWAHFEGQRIKRQMEVHPNIKPILLVAGTNDSEMCDLSLSETGLTEKQGAEVSKSAFEEEWERCMTLLGKEARAKKIMNILEDAGF